MVDWAHMPGCGLCGTLQEPISAGQVLFRYLSSHKRQAILTENNEVILKPTMDL